MKVLRHIIIVVIAYLCIFLYKVLAVGALRSTSYCRETLDNPNITEIEWSYLRECLQLVNGEVIPQNTKENAWRLMKLAFDTIDNIPSEAYKYMGYSLTTIPMDELRNISMDNVDVVEAFGAIRSETIANVYHEGFTAEQLSIIAQKVRSEWSGKNPQTYSEYDLKSMGEILCYLNVTDIENIHADALREAAEWIGLIQQCPQDRLQALANLARRPEAFGEPRKWSKLEVSIIGNILNGLSANDISSISKDKLQLNQFYKPKNKKPLSTNRARNNSTTSQGISPTDTTSMNSRQKDTNVN